MITNRKASHYHYFFAPAFLSSFLLALPCCRSLIACGARRLRIFVPLRLRYAPLWEIGRQAPPLHYHRGRRSSARLPRCTVHTVYTRLQFSGNNAAKPLRCRDTEVPSRSTSTIYKKKLPTTLRFSATTICKKRPSPHHKHTTIYRRKNIPLQNCRTPPLTLNITHPPT